MQNSSHNFSNGLNSFEITRSTKRVSNIDKNGLGRNSQIIELEKEKGLLKNGSQSSLIGGMKEPSIKMVDSFIKPGMKVSNHTTLAHTCYDQAKTSNNFSSNDCE